VIFTLISFDFTWAVASISLGSKKERVRVEKRRAEKRREENR
jgi:hypothetical protein